MIAAGELPALVDTEAPTGTVSVQAGDPWLKYILDVPGHTKWNTSPRITVSKAGEPNLVDVPPPFPKVTPLPVTQ